MAIYPFNGKIPQLGKHSWVHEQAHVSGDVHLGEYVSVWPMAVIRGDVMPIIIGARSNVQDGAVIHATHPSSYNPEGHATFIGEDVIIGHHAVIHGCRIENEVLIGMNATVLDGCHIEPQCIIAAAALVPPKKYLKSGHLYAGAPAKPLRELSENEKAFFKYSCAHYIQLAQNHQKF